MRLRQLIGALVIGLLLTLTSSPSVARADDYLIGSDPQPRQELKETPGWVTLAFRSKATAKLAKIVVLNAAATHTMRLRMETVTSLSEELFLLQTLGDDRSVVETYVAGKASKPQSGL